MPNSALSTFRALNSKLFALLNVDCLSVSVFVLSVTASHDLVGACVLDVLSEHRTTNVLHQRLFNQFCIAYASGESLSGAQMCGFCPFDCLVSCPLHPCYTHG